MYCHNCGTEIPEGNRFCENCGTEINGTEEKTEENKNSDLKKQGNNQENKKKNGKESRLSKKVIIITTLIIIAIIASIIGVNKFLNRKTELSSTQKGQIETAEEAGYKIRTERKTENIFIDNKSQILAQTVVDTPAVNGKKDLNTNVQKWTSGFKKNAVDFINSYKDIDPDEFIKEDAAFDTKIQGKEYPLFSYYKAEICREGKQSNIIFEPRKDNKILSVIYHEEIAPYASEFTSKYKTAVFNVKTGEKISLESLFNDYNNFCDSAGKYVVNKLLEKEEEYELIEGYRDIVLQNWREKDKAWYLSRNGFVFICPSEIAPHEISIEVPYAVIGGYMKEEYTPDEYETEIIEKYFDNNNKVRYTTHVKKNGEEIWSYRGPVVEMAQCRQMCAVAGNDYIYIADRSTLMKFKKETKTLLWKRNFENFSFGQMICDPLDHLYVISSLGGHILKISSEGKILWRTEVDGSDPKIFCLDNDDTQLEIVFHIPPDTQCILNTDTGEEI